MRGLKLISGLGAVSAVMLTTGLARAQDAALPIVGRPVDGGLGFQPAATSLASDIHWLDGMINYIIGAIVLFVVLLMAIVVIRYNTRLNPKPARFTHNTPVEVAWTIIPIVILVFIGAFSLPVLFKQQIIPQGDIVIKVTGNQWYWHYDYIDEDFGFDSFMIGQPATMTDADYQAGAKDYVLNDAMKAKLERAGYSADEFLLAVDNPVVLPIGKVVVMQVTGSDVIHSWKVPSFGVMQDAVPGRIAHLWFKPEKLGIYFGQCSELCGKDHAYMPIAVRVVSQEDYDKWLANAKQQFAEADVPQPVKLASN